MIIVINIIIKMIFFRANTLTILPPDTLMRISEGFSPVLYLKYTKTNGFPECSALRRVLEEKVKGRD